MDSISGLKVDINELTKATRNFNKNIGQSIKDIDKLNLEGDEAIGCAIVKRALEEPMRQLANNGGLEGSVIVEQAKKEKKTVGFNVETTRFEDMIEAGIIDPTKVTRSALQNATSVAGLLLTTEALVTEIPEKEKAPAMPPGAGGYPGEY